MDKSGTPTALLLLKTHSEKRNKNIKKILQTGETFPTSDEELDKNKQHPVADAFHYIDEDRAVF